MVLNIVSFDGMLNILQYFSVHDTNVISKSSLTHLRVAICFIFCKIKWNGKFTPHKKCVH